MKKLFLSLFIAAIAMAVYAQKPNAEGGRTVTEIRPSALPACVPEYIKLHLKDYKIEKAYKMDVNYIGRTTTSYYVSLANMNGTEVYYFFDKECRAAKEIRKDEFYQVVKLSQTVTPKPNENEPSNGTKKK